MQFTRQAFVCIVHSAGSSKHVQNYSKNVFPMCPIEGTTNETNNTLRLQAAGQSMYLIHPMQCQRTFIIISFLNIIRLTKKRQIIFAFACCDRSGAMFTLTTKAGQDKNK